MLTFEFNRKMNCIEVYGDAEGIKLLIKRLNALVRKDTGSYLAFGQGLDPKCNRENDLADYYSIFLCETLSSQELMGPSTPENWHPPMAGDWPVYSDKT